MLVRINESILFGEKNGRVLNFPLIYSLYGSYFIVFGYFDCFMCAKYVCQKYLRMISLDKIFQSAFKSE